MPSLKSSWLSTKASVPSFSSSSPSPSSSLTEWSAAEIIVSVLSLPGRWLESKSISARDEEDELSSTSTTVPVTAVVGREAAVVTGGIGGAVIVGTVAIAGKGTTGVASAAGGTTAGRGPRIVPPRMLGQATIVPFGPWAGLMEPGVMPFVVFGTRGIGGVALARSRSIWTLAGLIALL